jgi:hypothetical protein
MINNLSWMLTALMVGACLGHAQTVVEEFDLTASATDSSVSPDTFAYTDSPPILIVPDIPGYIVENVRIEFTINSAIFNVDTTGGDGLVAGTIISGVTFAGTSYHTDPPNNLFFDGTFTGYNTFPSLQQGGDLPWPHTIVYEFAAGNIPEAMGIFGGVNAIVAFGNPFGFASLSLDAHAKVTYNVEPARLVRLLDISDSVGRGIGTYSTALEFQTVEVPESIIINHEPVGEATEVKGTVLVYRDGLGQGPPEQVKVGTLVFQNDVIETLDNASVILAFIDTTTFAISDNARIAIDEYVFDPVAQSGSQNFSVLKGVFVFTSGLIGRDEAEVDENYTPYGGGIRGRNPGPGDYYAQEFVRPFDAQTEPFQIGFDYAFLDQGMTMEVYLDNLLIGTYSREWGEPDPEVFTQAIIDIDEENGLLLGPVELRFSVTGPVEGAYLIDNVTGPGFTDPGFDLGFGPWFTRGDGEIALAGVVYDELCLGNSNFDRDTQLAVPSDPLDMVKGDVNLDGKPDIVVLTGDLFNSGGPTAITVMLGDGAGGFTNATDYPLEAPATQILLHDVTGDVYPDIVFISQSGNEPSPTSYNDGINLMVNDGASGFGSPTTISQNPSDQPFVNSFTITDVNNDQVLDIPYFTGVGIEMRVLIGDGNGGFSEPNPGLSLGSQIVGAMISGDFDEDGDLDLAIGYSTGNVELLNNEGTGIFSRGTVLTTTNEVRQIIANDFNDDGNIDLAVRHWLQSPEAIHIFHGDGAGAFAPTQQLVSGLSAFNRITQMKAGDIDNDGDRDLVVMAQNSNSLTKLVNDGTGVFNEEIIAGDFVSLFAHGRGLVLIDVDRNGSLDVIGDDGFNQTISVFKSQCRTLCIADLTGDDELNFFDVSAFLLAFNSGDTIADFTNDGEFDFFDVSAFLQAFNAGCP